MFVKFTKKDGTPIWINANLIVTVEAVRNGGAIVVPVGDGLDYEVRESVETLIPMVEAAQDHGGVVPVPTTDGLGIPPHPKDIDHSSPTERFMKEMRMPPPPPRRRRDEAPAPAPVRAAESAPAEPAAPVEPAKPAPAEPAAPVTFDAPCETPSVTEAEAANAVAAVASIKAEIEKAAEEAAPKPLKRVKKARTKPVAPSTPATEGERKLPTRRRATQRRSPLELSVDEIDRLRAMAPRNVNKILNSLKAQFSVSDPEQTVKALVENGIISVDAANNHVTWLPAGG